MAVTAAAAEHAKRAGVLIPLSLPPLTEDVATTAILGLNLFCCTLLDVTTSLLWELPMFHVSDINVTNIVAFQTPLLL